jgi:anti-sigma factor RsiW
MGMNEDNEVRRVVQQHAQYFHAPDDLVQSIRSGAAGAEPSLTRKPGMHRIDWSTWLGWAAPRTIGAFAAGAVLAVLGMSLLWHRPNDDVQLVALLADHTRALVTESTIDVASASTHTVKPWLSAKLGYSPLVIDLAAQGYPLKGGRRGFIGATSVAVMVYAYHEHEIDLYAVRRGALPQFALRDNVRDGFNVRSWSDRDMVYVAVSDVAAARLDEFERLLREQANSTTD